MFKIRFSNGVRMLGENIFHCIILNNLSKFKTLKTDGIIIIHRHKNEKVSFDRKFNIVEEKKYGISKIIFLNILN